VVKDKKVIIDGKPVIFKSLQNTPSINTIKSAYSRIPDDKKIPVVFETKTQYLNEYIKNQEKKKRIDFTPSQEKQYKKTELRDMKNIISRYTTNHNPYIDRRVVFFTDKKIPKAQFEKSVMHEYGHELWEKNPRIRKNWSAVNKNTSPTPYGRTDRQEDFAESFMLHSEGRLRDPARNRIISDTTTKNNRLVTTRQSPMGNIMVNFLKPRTTSFNEFDVNHDGKINDLDMNILRRKHKMLTPDKTTRNNVADALGADVPEDTIFTNEWKLWGEQKEYHPGIQDYTNSAGNVAEILYRYKNKMNESGMPMTELLKPNTSKDFNLNLMLGKTSNQLPPDIRLRNILGTNNTGLTQNFAFTTALRKDVTSYNAETPEDYPVISEDFLPSGELGNANPEVSDKEKEKILRRAKKSYSSVSIPTKKDVDENKILEQKQLGRQETLKTLTKLNEQRQKEADREQKALEEKRILNIELRKQRAIESNYENKARLKEEQRQIKETKEIDAQRPTKTKALTRMHFAQQGIQVLDNPDTQIVDLSNPINRALAVLPEKQGSRISEAKDAVTSIGDYFVNKENAERQRLDDLDEKKKQNEQLQKLLFLKNQGLLGEQQGKTLDAIRTINIMNNPESVKAIQDYPIDRRPGKKRKVPYILDKPEDTFQSTAPDLWHL
jgi:hypothetical protein